MPFLDAGNPCPLDFGSSCLHSEEWTVLIYSEGRQPCPFWRLAVHDLWILAVHVYILKNGQSLYILETGSP
jgi:hypothetical protein